MTKEELENRLDMVEKMITKGVTKDLPFLNAMYQKLLDKLVELDLKGD